MLTILVFNKTLNAVYCFQRETKMFSRTEEEKAKSHKEDQHLHRLIYHLLCSLCNYKVSQPDSSS